MKWDKTPRTPATCFRADVLFGPFFNLEEYRRNVACKQWPTFNRLEWRYIPEIGILFNFIHFTG
jgi:hypothetical protein